MPSGDDYEINDATIFLQGQAHEGGEAGIASPQKHPDPEVPTATQGVDG